MTGARDKGIKNGPLPSRLLAGDDIAHLIVDEDSFVGRARRRKVLPPTARDFDPAAWTADFRAYGKGERDARLHEAGLWFGEALALRWTALLPYRFETLPLDPVTRQLAGIANEVQLLTEAKLVEASINRDASDNSNRSIAHLKLEIGQGVATADMVRTSVIDTLGTLARLVRTDVAKGSGRGRFDRKAFLAAIPIFEDIYLLEFFWGRMLWLDWSVEPLPMAVRFTGSVHDALEASVAVSNWRRSELAVEFDAIYSREWAEPNSVLPPVWKVTTRKYAQGYRFKAERRPPGEGRLSTVYLMREMLSDTELAPYLETPLPKLSEPLTLDDLLAAWKLLALAARAIEGELFKLSPNLPHARYGPAVRLEDLDALLAVLEWSSSKRAAALAFFTFEERSQDGLWSRPLLPIGKARVVPVLAPLVVPNLYRTAELWVAEGAGENIFRDRGTAYEAKLRDKIVKALRKRPWRDRVSVMREKWEPKIEGTPRDIDMLIRVGGLVFVGELKLKKFPASAAEIGRHASEFVHAAEQLDIRLPWLDDHKAEIARRTGFAGPPETLRLLGMVITGTQFGSGCVVHGYPVIDGDTLAFFFEWEQFMIAVDFDRASGYAPRTPKPNFAIDLVAEDVAASFLAYLRDPWPVRYAELALMRETRTASLKLSGQALSWPDHHLDGDIFGRQSVGALIERFRAQTEVWRADARTGLSGGAREAHPALH